MEEVMDEPHLFFVLASHYGINQIDEADMSA
jgi:hypothetical protein